MTEKNILKVLYFLSNTKEATSEQICLGTGLRQPEISMACNELIERRWIASRRESGERGRPYHVYKLKNTLEQIKDLYRFQIEDESKSKFMEVCKILGGK